MTLHKLVLIASVMSALSALAVGCAADAGDEEDATSDDAEELRGDPRDVAIGFNGGPDQFDYYADFYGAANARADERLCHTYVAWNVGEAAPDPGSASSAVGSRGWLTTWLRKAQGHCDEALVTFKSHETGDPPSANRFAAAFKAFLAVPWAAETGFTGKLAFTAWNEPNNPAGSGNGLGKKIEPELAARYYLAMVKPCEQHGCKAVAGDFASNGDTWNDFEWNCADDNVSPRELCAHPSSANPHGRPASYLDRYKNTIVNEADRFGLPKTFRPKYFAFHGWHDVNRYLDKGAHCTSYDDCATRRVLKAFGGSWGSVQLWDTEVGVDQDGPPISNDEQACGAAFMLRVTTLSRRIKRLYYTRLHGGSGELERGHVARPALEVVQQRDMHFTKARCK